MQIGLSSIVGDGFGFGSFVFGEVPSGGGTPSGVAYTEYGVTYPIEEGGGSVSISQLPAESSTYPSQICDVDYVYEAFPPYEVVVDWSSARNIAYRPNGYYFAGDGIPSSQTPVEIPFESTNYYDSEYIQEYAALSDGSGGYSWIAYNVSFWPEYTEIFRDYDNELIYYWDGDGGYFTTSLY